jgi:integrase
MVRKPQSPQARSRVLIDEEVAKLLQALEPIGRRSHWTKPAVQLALATAMRRGELLTLKWENVDLQSRTVFLPDTKNGDSRTVPLSSVAVQVLAELPRHISGFVIPVKYFTLDAAFKRGVRRAGLDGVRFHDLRRTAITRMAEKLPNVIELAAVSGHKSLMVLKRYYCPTAAELAKKLG